MKEYLIDHSDLNKYTKPISNLRDMESDKFAINEAQQMDIKPVITDAILLDLLEYIGQDDTPDETRNTLLNGGTYEYKGIKYYLSGLKAAHAYYTYSRLVANSFDLTRFGSVQRNDQYSTNTADLQRKTLQNDARDTANIYMEECIQFIKSHPDTFNFGSTETKTTKFLTIYKKQR